MNEFKEISISLLIIALFAFLVIEICRYKDEKEKYPFLLGVKITFSFFIAGLIIAASKAFSSEILVILSSIAFGALIIIFGTFWGIKDYYKKSIEK